MNRKEMSLRQNVFTIVVAILCILILSTTKIHAATYGPYSSINAISPNKTVINTIKNGTISACKYKGSWCYKFTKGKNVVYIKTKAFTGKVNNNTTNVNKKLTDNVNKFQNSGYIGYIYSTKNRYNDPLWPSSGPMISKKDTWNISGYNVKETVGNDYVRLRCDHMGGVELTYHEKVVVQSGPKKIAKAPSNAKEYKKALERKTSVKASAPKWIFKITKPGSTRTYFSDYTMVGNGYNPSNKIDASKYIDITYSTAKCAAGVVSGQYSSCLSTIVKVYQTFEKKSSNYATDGHKDLSVSNKWCYTFSPKSPITMNKSGNYLETSIFFGDRISKNKTKTVMNISFSVR